MMKIILESKQDIIEQKLRNYINSPIDPIIFDITLDSTSHQILSLSDNGKYTLSFSRPLFINIFTPPLAEYEFVFSFNNTSSIESVIIEGKIRLKRYIIGAVLLVCFVLMYKTYDILYGEAPLDYFFLIIMPLIVCFYLIIEYFFFRKKIKKNINNLSI